MRFTLASVAATLAAVSPAVACLHAYAYISHSPLTGDGIDGNAYVDDVGRRVCDARWGVWIDQDDHFALGCLPGYAFSVGRRCERIWFINSAGTFYTWGVSPWNEVYCCIGACDDRGVGINCHDYMVDDTFCGKKRDTSIGFSSSNSSVEITHKDSVPAGMTFKQLYRAPEYPVGELPADE